MILWLGETVLACGVQDLSINHRQFLYEVLHHITIARAFFHISALVLTQRVCYTIFNRREPNWSVDHLFVMSPLMPAAA